MGGALAAVAGARGRGGRAGRAGRVAVGGLRAHAAAAAAPRLGRQPVPARPPPPAAAPASLPATQPALQEHQVRTNSTFCYRYDDGDSFDSFQFIQTSSCLPDPC